MNSFVESFLLLQALTKKVIRLEEVLGEDWPDVRCEMLDALDLLENSYVDEDALEAVERLLEVGLDSPAAELFRTFEDTIEDAIETQGLPTALNVDLSDTEMLSDILPAGALPNGLLPENVQLTDLQSAGQVLADRLRWIDE